MVAELFPNNPPLPAPPHLARPYFLVTHGAPYFLFCFCFCFCFCFFRALCSGHGHGEGISKGKESVEASTKEDTQGNESKGSFFRYNRTFPLTETPGETGRRTLYVCRTKESKKKINTSCVLQTTMRVWKVHIPFSLFLLLGTSEVREASELEAVAAPAVLFLSQDGAGLSLIAQAW